MYRLNLPKHSLEEFFDGLLKGRRNNEKNNFIVTRLSNIKSDLVDAEKKYISLAEEKLLHTIPVQKIINIPEIVELSDGIPRAILDWEIEKVYSNYLVDTPGSQKVGREVYESVISNAYHNLCPYCSHREVKTVDHYLPKTKFLSFAITPVNLLPCCSDCNKDKLDSHELDAKKMLIHPYFEETCHIKWLKCEVKENLWPITFTYEVSNDIQDSVLKSRINYQFDLLNLGKLYADNAAREFNNRVKSLIREYNSNPSNKTLDFINDNFESYSSENANSWQTNMFEALKKSKWFIEEALPNVQAYYLK
ncbi:Uncharacterised protein [Paenibacillus polymyxa]|uniref:hypothetical protein n=1 Tax=Paenibacillus polymyxa TaxID=1406 RepID=UPI000D828952|nr:hypothetical protein [Paenibacillus polymyxa]SPY17280.1 Uncharacterised protein [Paenibacillus polymyxa]